MPEPDPRRGDRLLAAGRPYPLGAAPQDGGVNFSLYAPEAVAVELCFFATPDAPRPERVLVLTADHHRTGPYRHVFVPGAAAGDVYGYRVRQRRADPALGPAADGEKLLLDPYARAVAGLEIYDRAAAARPGDNTARALRSVVVDPDDEPPSPPLPPAADRPLAYELHVRGFTASPNSGLPAALRGTYAGLIEKIPYLQELGVTAVELLPILQFDPQDTPAGLPNYWGYSPIAFCAPHAAYSSDRTPLGPRREFRRLVAALHAAGIRVVLDVVFNHTAEGGRHGPVLSFRGLADDEYYLRDETGTVYADFTGCGNTFAANGPPGLRLALDALRVWVREYGVDGFRFDLASALTRDTTGHPRRDAPVVWAADTDPVLAATDLIAEAWDIGGLYQVGHFPGRRFAQWNDRFRDDVRRFLTARDGTVEPLMARIVGSPDLFAPPRHTPWRSVNFVACHDGFTLNDVVTYNRKHNEANGESSHDGRDENWSWNSGLEGPTQAPEIVAVRSRQVRNFLCALFLTHGQPLLLMGDEIRRTQLGNNNAYCQDNALSWFDWSGIERHGDLLRFVRELIAFSQRIRVLQEDRYWTVTEPGRPGILSWHGVDPAKPDWGPTSHTLAYTLEAPGGDQSTYLLLNAYWRPLEFRVPHPPRGLDWRRIVDTAQEPPGDIVPFAEAKRFDGGKHRAEAHSVLVLHAERLE
jgi:glycogen operon protein